MTTQFPLTAPTAFPKPMETHPILKDLLFQYITRELPPLPPLSGPLTNTWRSHTSYKGLKHEPYEIPEGTKANDYERLE